MGWIPAYGHKGTWTEDRNMASNLKLTGECIFVALVAVPYCTVSKLYCTYGPICKGGQRYVDRESSEQRWCLSCLSGERR
jgi:hypothetical protein